ncbi:MAG TPA: hypothetical protein VGE14_12960 [Marmoricola sp.]
MSSPTSFHEGVLRKVRRRLAWAVRDRWPTRRVVREVQGVELTLPWSHRLPDYTQGDSPYGQNLVQLAAGLARGGQIVVIDIGANVGDSALQIAHATDAVVVCVEGDPYYLDYLVTNTAGDDRFRIEHALLVPTEDDQGAGMRAMRVGGTTRFVPDSVGNGVPTITPTGLRHLHPCTEDLRLVKSDTDGYDVALVPAMARAWRDLHPVLFFEYDLRLSRESGLDPLEVWSSLAELGYTHVAVWGNGGHALGRTTVAAMPSASTALDGPRERDAPTYWDVAVAHGSDAPAIEVLRDLVPHELSAQTGR